MTLPRSFPAGLACGLAISGAIVAFAFRAAPDPGLADLASGVADLNDRLKDCAGGRPGRPEVRTKSDITTEEIRLADERGMR